MSDSIGQVLVSQFDRMVKHDGGHVTLLDDGADVIRVGYKLGNPDPECVDGVCVMPHVELQELMRETLRRRHPELDLVVELVR